MGKRVDFACRSVISPDPYVGTNEIGIPLHFAKTLTYPTPVTGLNAVLMRQLVIRGPDEYPGAVWVQFPDGRRVQLGKMDRHRRVGVAARLLTHLKKGGPPATVGRQLRNGDMMLVNRQVSSWRRAFYCLAIERPVKKHLSCTTLNMRMLDYDPYIGGDGSFVSVIADCVAICRLQSLGVRHLASYRGFSEPFAAMCDVVRFPSLTIVFALHFALSRPFTNPESWRIRCEYFTVRRKKQLECITQVSSRKMCLMMVGHNPI